MKRIGILLLELGLVAMAVFVADWLQGVVDVIPRWLIRLPEVDYQPDDFWTVARYFLAVHAVTLGAGQLFLGPWSPTDARRTVNELLLLAVGFAIAALLVFVTTTVAFDPQFVVGILLVNAVTFTLIHFALRMPTAGMGTTVGVFVGALVRRLFSVTGIVALALAVSPGILAKLFVSDRDVANVITQIRIKLSTDATGDWTVENAVGGQKFSQPILVQFPPGVTSEMYVLERQGRLLAVPWKVPGGPRPVLDISARVGEVEVENGALGFAFHPEFGRPDSPNVGFVYLYYTSVLDGEQVNYLSRFDLAAGDAVAAAASETVLIEIDRAEDGFHNGGSVEFGPDGFLYVALGEMSDRDAHQKIDSGLAGGILRIDVDRRGGDVSHPIVAHPDNARTDHYYIPSDNPFVGMDGALEEFYAMGLRNPFRIAFDPENGNIWAGEVGSTVWEEVNLVRRGGNYQYPFIEGREATGRERPANPVGEEVPPVYTYRHTAYERAVIGGIVYRGDRYPQLSGKYLFGDNYSGNIYALPADGEPVESVELVGKANQFAQRGITSFTETPDGEILLTTLGSTSGSQGEIVRLVPRDKAAVAVRSPAEEEVVTLADARVLYATNCSRCHGVDGLGDGPDAKLLGVPVPSFGSSEFQKARSDEDLYAVIENGGAARGLSAMMPPWGMALSDAEIEALVKLVRKQGDDAASR